MAPSRLPPTQAEPSRPPPEPPATGDQLGDVRGGGGPGAGPLPRRVGRRQTGWQLGITRRLKSSVQPYGEMNWKKCVRINIENVFYDVAVLGMKFANFSNEEQHQHG